MKPRVLSQAVSAAPATAEAACCAPERVASQACPAAEATDEATLEAAFSAPSTRLPTVPIRPPDDSSCRVPRWDVLGEGPPARSRPDCCPAVAKPRFPVSAMLHLP